MILQQLFEASQQDARKLGLRFQQAFISAAESFGANHEGLDISLKLKALMKKSGLFPAWVIIFDAICRDVTVTVKLTYEDEDTQAYIHIIDQDVRLYVADISPLAEIDKMIGSINVLLDGICEHVGKLVIHRLNKQAIEYRAERGLISSLLSWTPRAKQLAYANRPVPCELSLSDITSLALSRIGEAYIRGHEIHSAEIYKLSDKPQDVKSWGDAITKFLSDEPEIFLQNGDPNSQYQSVIFIYGVKP